MVAAAAVVVFVFVVEKAKLLSDRLLLRLLCSTSSLPNAITRASGSDISGACATS